MARKSVTIKRKTQIKPGVLYRVELHDEEWEVHELYTDTRCEVYRKHWHALVPIRPSVYDLDPGCFEKDEHYRAQQRELAQEERYTDVESDEELTGANPMD